MAEETEASAASAERQKPTTNTTAGNSPRTSHRIQRQRQERSTRSALTAGPTRYLAAHTGISSSEDKPTPSSKEARIAASASGQWPTGSHSGRLGVMCKTIATYCLYGLDAIPADVIVEGDGVRVVERRSGRTLVDVKQESDTRKRAGVQPIGPNLVRRESASETMTTGQPSLSYPISPF
jgi:hypothetical protein